jgi:hypothetical protein
MQRWYSEGSGERGRAAPRGPRQSPYPCQPARAPRLNTWRSRERMWRVADPLHDCACARVAAGQVSDQHIETRTCNALLGALPALPHLEELVLPEARVGAWELEEAGGKLGSSWGRSRGGQCWQRLQAQYAMTGMQRSRLTDWLSSASTACAAPSPPQVKDAGWLALQQCTRLQRLHLYSIELKGQASGAAAQWGQEATCTYRFPTLSFVCVPSSLRRSACPHALPHAPHLASSPPCLPPPPTFLLTPPSPACRSARAPRAASRGGAGCGWRTRACLSWRPWRRCRGCR